MLGRVQGTGRQLEPAAVAVGLEAPQRVGVDVEGGQTVAGRQPSPQVLGHRVALEAPPPDRFSAHVTSFRPHAQSGRAR